MEIKARSIWSKYSKKLAFEKEPRSIEQNSKWLSGGTLNACYNCVDRHYLKNKKSIAFTVITDRARDYNVTFDQLYQEVNKYAYHLSYNGVASGDKVLIYLQNSPELIYSMLACSRIGAVHSVVFSGLGKSQLEYFIANIKPSAIIFQKKIFRKGEYITMPGIESFDNYKGRVIELNDLKNAKSIEIEPSAVPSDHPLFILHSSGTTADPKGITHTTGGYLLGAIYSFEKVFNLKKDEVFFCTADIGWIMGHTYNVYAPLLNGQRFLLDEGSIEYPDFNRWKKIIEKYKVDVFYTSPSAMRMLRQNKIVLSLCRPRMIALSGEVLDSETYSWLKKHFLFKDGKLLNLWWQSETGSIFTDGRAVISGHRVSVGKILSPYSVKIYKDELILNAHFPSKYQYKIIDGKQVKSNLESLSTGDSAEIKNGSIFINGRVDDLIISAAHKFSPIQIENEVNKIKGVKESVAYGVYDSIKGKLIQLDVVAQPQDQARIKQEVLTKIHSNIGPIATLKDICFVDKLNKTKSGKIIRRPKKAGVFI